MSSSTAKSAKDTNNKPSAVVADYNKFDNPKTKEYEFFGPLGALGVITGCSTIVFLWYFGCNESTGCNLPLTKLQWAQIGQGLKQTLLTFSTENIAFDSTVFGYYVCWFLWFAVLWYIAPGKVVKGVVLRNGQQLDYNLNGFSSMLITVVVGLGIYYQQGIAPFIWIADHYLQFVMSSLIFATGLALFVYLYSFRSTTTVSDVKVMLALGGNSENILYDFFIGRELNPRIFGGTFDIKYFCELRPGILGWALLNICFAIKQYDQIGYVTNSMWLAIIPQIVYCIDTLWFDDAVLTTMDIVTDGFGWMLAFGDLCWVPSMYCLQARFLSFHPVVHSSMFTWFVAILGFIGFMTFRLSNSEKNAFRRDPNQPSVRHLQYITTESGSKLLVSGWWGMARHINYTGDWFFGLAQCLATGFETPMTYFFAAYFLVLLLHRNSRDEHKCRHKYKKDWDVYCERVPYLFIPFII
ncbi:erg24, C-14 sterol reductase [Mycoemilia scoparia]|uniref:Delta(14)-sterol reductase n=1 Tax=Mycoemilia scoparia TaxID=417184 RepID=A0A9W7ZKB6_9FUNG|nr:erg24, C-14 sterol reductase [Mycoemilia scoparia]